ncbi:FAD-binding oxidoreductase [Telluribacter sp. SYSU D00476]|uniref:FAD-binding oxidoreductase n=1 Tax=Telluribacter sp. SYSU D00476 TaxID=2811430 RepID=UPI001FF48D36|nr:FAD-linked oxidase C-terminal domain-containing protein [Telluribacter sp. SYSU D00476]
MNKVLTISVFDELRDLLGDRVTQDTDICREHGAGYSYHTCMPPDLVVYPSCTEEVAAVVSICARHKVPVIPFGAGTSVEGHVAALEGGVCIDLRQMHQVIQVSYEDMYVTVQAGVTRNQLDKLLERGGFFFPIGPGVNATLGGMAGTRASGTNAVRYGTMKDNVLALTVVLPDGQIIQTGSKARKSSAGYDLTRLFVGSEGTLGVITELTLRLHPCPETIRAAVCMFPTVEAAVKTAITTIQKGIPIARVELLDTVMMRAVNQYSYLDYDEKPTLFMEFHGTAGEVDEQVRKVQEYAEAQAVSGFVWADDEPSRTRLWRARTDAAPAAMALIPGSQLMGTDVCVPISRLAKCIVDTQADAEATGVLAPIVGHVGDGNFHLTMLIHPDDPDGFEKAKDLNERLVLRALAMEGTCSGEHGIGMGKLPYMPMEHKGALQVMRAIKQAIDPDNRMNPGKLLPPI